MVLGASEDSIATSALGLVGVAITAAVAFATTWRWPTLRRRVQDHVAIVKDLPEGYGADLRKLLEMELALLARREQRVLDHSPWLILRVALRVASTAAVLVLGGAAILAYLGRSDAAYGVLIIGGGILLAIFIWIGLSAYLLLHRTHWWRRVVLKRLEVLRGKLGL